jgi:hypothetical protein
LVVFSHVSVVGLNWDSIVELESERDNRVIHKDDVFLFSVHDHSQILNVEHILAFNAMLPIEPMLDESTIVYLIQNGIGIFLLSCRKNCDFIKLG